MNAESTVAGVITAWNNYTTFTSCNTKRDWSLLLYLCCFRKILQHMVVTYLLKCLVSIPRVPYLLPRTALLAHCSWNKKIFVSIYCAHINKPRELQHFCNLPQRVDWKCTNYPRETKGTHPQAKVATPWGKRHTQNVWGKLQKYNKQQTNKVRGIKILVMQSPLLLLQFNNMPYFLGSSFV